MPIKGINKKVRTSTYGSPENNQHGYRPYGLTPDYSVPEPKTPDPNVSGTTYGNIPFGQRLNAVFGQVKPTAEQAAGKFEVFTDPGEGAGTSTNPPAGQYPPNPTPMQGPGDRRAGAVMPKIQVQGDPRSAYYHTAVGSKLKDQTNVDPRQNPNYGMRSENPPAKIPAVPGKSGSSEVFRA